MEIKNTILRNTFYSSISIYTEYLLGLICSVVIARSLGAIDYGIYSLLIWVSASSIILINGGLNTGQIKFLSEFKKTYGDEYAFNALQYFRNIHTIKTVIILILGVLLSSFILERFKLNEYNLYYWIILASAVFRGRYMFNVSVAKGFEQFDKLSKLTLIVSPINLVLVIVAGVYHDNINAFIYIYLITGILFYFFSKFLIITPNKPIITSKNLNSVDSKRIKNYLKITSVIVILTYFVSKELELFMLGWLADSSDAGMFRIAMTLAGSILLMVPGVFSSVLLPVMSKSLAESEKIAGRRFYYSTRILIILSIPIVVFVSYISTPLVVAVYGYEYRNAGIALSICIIAISIVTIADSAQSYLLSAEKQKIVLYILIVALCLKILVGYILISNYQLIGAAVTYLITISFSYISRIYLACYSLKTNFPIASLIKCIIVSLLCLVPIILIGERFNNYINLILFSLLYILFFIIFSFLSRLWLKEDIQMFSILASKIPNKNMQHIIVKLLSYSK